jgi:hypothetical protein
LYEHGAYPNLPSESHALAAQSHGRTSTLAHHSGNVVNVPHIWLKSHVKKLFLYLVLSQDNCWHYCRLVTFPFIASVYVNILFS